MALTQITFNDKVENNGATVEGQGRAVDWNEVKTVTNGVINSLEDTVVKIGSNAGATAQGENSVAIGKSAGNNTMGANTVAVGVDAGSNTIGSGSVAVGNNAGQALMGMQSVAIGLFAGNSSMGASSVAVGNNAGKNSMGASSVAVGVNAGLSASGANNTCIGNSAGSSLTTETVSTCLGFNAQVTASNQVQLGGSTTTTYAYGAVQDRSDERDKADIQNVHLGLDFIEALTPRSYKLDYREDYREDTTQMQSVVVGQDEEGNDIVEQQEVFIPEIAYTVA
jgi:hypothetical protein